MGFINRVFPAAQLESGLDSLLDELLTKSGAVLRVALKGLRELALRDFAQALKFSEQLYCRELLATEDVEEGVQAFLEKRKPRWTHC
jgi:enoyl-CoA hydratase/carnithine racemase